MMDEISSVDREISHQPNLFMSEDYGRINP